VQLVDAQVALSELRFGEAISKARPAIDLAGTQNKEIAILARLTLGLAMALSGDTRAGRRLCDDAVTLGKAESNPRLLSNALLILARVMLESREAQAALSTALESSERFEREGQQDSGWQASLVAARASQLMGDKDAAHKYASKASTLLAELRRKWGEESFNRYINRPDVQNCRRQIDRLLAIGK
jgi:ATP/maltotriose-dependent transcriptional regulator MalT